MTYGTVHDGGMTTDTKLPTIIRYDLVHDSGEYGNASCPHCGADGRYVYFFTVEGGEKHGAMAGCIKLFPVSPLARAHKAILDKQRKGADLNRWDEAILEAINAAADGTLTTESAESVVRTQQANRAAWMRKRFGGRR